LSTIILTTVAPPILDMATNTEDNPRIPLVSSAQYNEPQQAAAMTKQIAAQKIKLYLANTNI